MPPATLAASGSSGSSCAVVVTFSPTAAGARAGQFSVSDSAVTSPQTATLSGTGVAVLQSIAVAPSTATIGVGQSQSFTATGSFNDGSQQDLTASASWSSSNSAVATVSKNLATGKGAGTTTIRASQSGVSGTSTLKVTSVAPPVIASFTAGASTITAGNSTTLTANFSGGTGSINNGVGAVTSGTPVMITPASTTTYTLTVTNSAGTSVTASTTVTVVPAPVINSFTAGASTITAGSSTTLTANFTGGTGSINNGVGAVISGMPATVTPGSTTTYTLTVTNGAGTSVTAIATVTVVAAPAITSFTAGASAVTPGNSTTLTGVFSGGNGSISNGVGPVTSGSAATVTPAGSTTYTLTVTNAAATSVTATVTVAVVDGLFKNVSNLDIVNHTATLLNNGLVLIAGGYATSGSQQAVTPQLYNPVTGTFVPTGSMNNPRTYPPPTATLLNNGTVLIAGGGGPAGMIASAEIYDPVAGTFTLTGSMNVARGWDRATLLDNGTVLITGGASVYGQPTNIAELYDPTAGTFTEIANPMAAARWNYFSATLLNNGTVLIAGGQDSNYNNLASAELYDPVAQTFTATASMTDARSYQTATLLNDGSVLIAGGCYDPSSYALSTAELYTPSGLTTGNFITTGSMVNPHCFQAAFMLTNGTVLIAGGQDSSFNPIAGAEIYDPSSGAFISTGNLNNARYDFTATLLNDGTVLATGGWTNSPPTTATTELYTSATLTPPNLTSISVAPANPTIAVGEAMRFIATGTYQDNSTQQLGSVSWISSNPAVAQITNDATNFGAGFGLTSGMATIQACAGGTCGSTTLTVGASPNYTQLPATPGNSFGMGMVFVPSDLSGGSNYTLFFDGHSLSTWTFSSGSWTLQSPANSPTARDGEGMAYDASTQTVVLFGGSNSGNDLSDTWIWDGTSWTQANPLTVPPGRRFDTQGMAYLPSNGTVVMFGGVTQGGVMFGDTWTWSGVNQAWTQQAPASSPAARRAPLAYDPSSGKVLLFGGEGSYSGPTYGDTWLWDGGNWTQQNPVTSPPARSMASMAYDSALGNLVLFGGSQAGSGAPYFSDTWLWNGATWSPFYPPGGVRPPERYAFGMAYDPSQGVLIYGGLDNHDSVTLGDMWALTP